MSRYNYFESPFKGTPLDEQVKNPNIIVGRYSYYSGYYHGHSFDECARYLMPDRDDVDKLIIGSFCSIGTGVSFVMAGNQGHRTEWVSTFHFFYVDEECMEEAPNGYLSAGNTEIGHDVWIGAEVMIMPGIKIGNGAIIGARSVVTKDIEPYTIVAGNPAKPIRKRFTEDQIKRLLEMEWWNWSEEYLAQSMKLLCSENIDGLYEEWSKWKTQKQLSKEKPPITPIIVRPYHENDTEELAKIYYNTIHGINSRDYTKEQVDVWAPESSLQPERWLKKFQRTKPFVATANGKTVGFAEFESNGHIDCFYCHHEWVGKGVGKALLKAINAKAVEYKFDKIFAEVSITAKPFFERNGFKVIRKQEIEKEGVKLVNFQMEKRIER